MLESFMKEGQSNYGHSSEQSERFRIAGLSAFELNVYMLSGGGGDTYEYETVDIAFIMRS